MSVSVSSSCSAIQLRGWSRAGYADPANLAVARAGPHHQIWAAILGGWLRQQGIMPVLVSARFIENCKQTRYWTSTAAAVGHGCKWKIAKIDISQNDSRQKGCSQMIELDCAFGFKNRRYLSMLSAWQHSSWGQSGPFSWCQFIYIEISCLTRTLITIHISVCMLI